MVYLERSRAQSHCCFVVLLIDFTPDLLTYSAPLFLKRQCDRTLGDNSSQPRMGAETAWQPLSADQVALLAEMVADGTAADIVRSPSAASRVFTSFLTYHGKRSKDPGLYIFTSAASWALVQD